METATSIELQNLTQHLVRQPSTRALLAEYIHHLRTWNVPLAWPADLPGDLRADEIDPEQPLIIHLPGRSNRAVLLGVGFEPPEAPVEDFGTGPRLRPIYGADVVQEFDRNGLPRSIYGPGALTTAAPLAIAAWIVRELRQIGEELPGHVILVVAPGAGNGGEPFEAAGERVRDLLNEHRLRPLMALVPGRVRPGASPRRHQHIVATTGSIGMFTVQLFVAGQTASPEARFRALDPLALTAALVNDLTTGEGSRRDSNLPPPVVLGQSSALSPAPGWPPAWSAVRIGFFIEDDDPAKLMAHINPACERVFRGHLQSLGGQTSRNRGSGGEHSRVVPWQPLVLAFRELRRTCRYELPPIEPPPDGMPPSERLLAMQEQALRRVRFAYEHSPQAGTPMVVVGFAPPCLPPYRLDPEDTVVKPVLKKTAKEYSALRTPNGLLLGGWQRLALAGWNSRHARAVQDDTPLVDQPTGFGLRTVWNAWPLLGFGPSGRDAGTRSECVDVEPSFTRLPEFLRTLTVRLLALEERPTVFETAWTRLRRWSARLGLIRRPDDVDDDDELLFPGPADAGKAENESDEDKADGSTDDLPGESAAGAAASTDTAAIGPTRLAGEAATDSDDSD